MATRIERVSIETKENRKIQASTEKVLRATLSTHIAIAYCKSKHRTQSESPTGKLCTEYMVGKSYGHKRAPIARSESPTGMSEHR